MAAKEKCGVDFPVVCLNMNLHATPKKMREELIMTMSKRIPKAYDTVLVAQGYCGGVWEDVAFDRKVVIPRVDDCVTMALQMTDHYSPDLKKKGHYYLFNIMSGLFSPKKMFNKFTKQYGKEKTQEIFDDWFKDYPYLDVVTSECENRNNQKYQSEIQDSAQLIKAQIQYVPGSNLLIEKLLTGRWDEQFIVKAPGERISMSDFFEKNWLDYQESK
jgi:hypothetical protein